MPPTRIIIFVTPAEHGMWGVQFRAFGVHVHVVEGHMSRERERDAALTEARTYDILRVRIVEEAKAVLRRSLS